MSRQILETHTNGQHDEHYKIVVVGGGLVRFTHFNFNQRVFFKKYS